MSYIDDGDDNDDNGDDDDAPVEDDQDEPEASDASQSDDTLGSNDAAQTGGTGIAGQALQITKLPKSFRMSAPMVNEVSHTRKVARLRERRLKQDQAVQDALKEISLPENSLTTAQTIDDINTAHEARSAERNTLQDFESSKSRLKQLHTQRLRTKRTWAKLCAAERRHVRRHALEGTQAQGGSPSAAYTTAGPFAASTSTTATMQPTVSAVDGWCTQCNRHHIPNEPESRMFKHVTQCPKSQPELRPVLLIGEAGTGVGSRIGGYQRRGGGKMREQHRRYCTIGMTNEYRTSKTCIYCSCQVRQARAVVRSTERSSLSTFTMQPSVLIQNVPR